MSDQVAGLLPDAAGGERTKVMVLDFRVSYTGADRKPTDKELAELGSRATEEFIADVMQKLGREGRRDRIAMIDRGRLDNILQERKIAAGDRSPAELASLAGVDVVITGSVQTDGKTSALMVKVVRVRDGEILGMARQAGQERPQREAFEPVTMIDGVEKIGIGEWKALPLAVANAGTLGVSVAVEHGNPIDVLVIPGAELDHLKKNEAFVRVSAFTAANTRKYQRKADLEAGGYYLVLRDSSTGIFSKMRSEVRVTVRLEP